MKLTTLTTPRGIAVYPHLNAPDTKFESQQNKGGEWHTSLRLPEDSALPLVEKLEATLTEWIKVKNAEQKEMRRKPYKRFDTPWAQVEDEDGNPTGAYIFKFKRGVQWTDRDGNVRTNKIEFVDGQRQTIGNLEDAIMGGSELCVNFSVRGWASPLGISVALDLQKVQIVRLADAPAGDESNPFETFEDAESISSGAAAPQPATGPSSGPDPDDIDDTPACEDTQETTVLDGDF